MEVKIKIILINKDISFMGIGLIELLKKTDSMYSIRKAASDMGLSYPKALKIINRLEQALSRTIVERKRGGKGGGGAQLTPFGREFLAKYENYREKVIEFAEKTFKEEFNSFEE